MKYEGKAIAVIVVWLPGGLLCSCPNIPVGIYDKTAITMKRYDVSHLIYVLIYFKNVIMKIAIIFVLH